jgi:hypothetical protein
MGLRAHEPKGQAQISREKRKWFIRLQENVRGVMS